MNQLLGIDMKTGGGDWPARILRHAAGIDENGEFVVIEAWESRDAQGSWMQGRLARALQEAGITAVPTITWLDLFAHHTPQGAAVH